MGLAKYMEDNIEIFNDRMYKKGIKVVDLKDFKKQRKTNLVNFEEEYFLVLKEIEKIAIWLNIINIAGDTIKTDFIIQIMDKQKEQLYKAKDEYIDYKFDPKFKHFRHKQFDIPEQELKIYKRKIIENYLQYFLDNLKEMENVTDDDAIKMNFLYFDINNFIEKFLYIKTDEIQIPLVQYIIENILEEKGKGWVLCNNCGNKTYRDFYSCIYCKYPNEVR